MFPSKRNLTQHKKTTIIGQQPNAGRLLSPPPPIPSPSLTPVSSWAVPSALRSHSNKNNNSKKRDSSRTSQYTYHTPSSMKVPQSPSDLQTDNCQEEEENELAHQCRTPSSPPSPHLSPSVPCCTAAAAGVACIELARLFRAESLTKIAVEPALVQKRARLFRVESRTSTWYKK